MTKEEKEDPQLLNSSRIHRVARGSGVSERDVKELANQFFAMKKMMKKFMRQRSPMFGKMRRGLT